MNLVADESVDRQIVERLRDDGHEVTCIAEVEPSISDEAVMAQANAASALLVTADKDFGELVFRQGLVHSGVVLLRLAGLSAERKGALLSAAIREHGQDMQGAFSAVTSGQVRIRRRVS